MPSPWARSPPGRPVRLSNGTGSVTANVTNANITCSTNTFTIGGTISGLVSTQQVTLNNNGGNPLTVTVADGGNFTFTTPIAYNTGYAVTVGTQPTAEFCRITNGTGTNVTANVTTVSVSCRPATAYVANSADGTVSQYTIGVDDGALTSLGAAVAAGTTPRAVAVDPTGRYAYVANYGGATISQYTIGANGSLTAMTTATVATEVQPWGLAVHPSGQYVYVTNRGFQHRVAVHVGAGGELTPMTPAATVPTGTEPFGITISPDGQHAYVANFGNGAVFGTSISQYNIGVMARSPP